MPHRPLVGILSPSPLNALGLRAVLEQGHDFIRTRDITWNEAETVDLLVYDTHGLYHHPHDVDRLRALVRGTNLPVLAVTEPLRPDLDAGVVAAGVRARIPADSPPDRFLITVRRLLADSKHIRKQDDVDPGRRDQLHDELRERYGLSGQEFRVLELIASGLSNEEVAQTMYVSLNTVKTYVRTAYRKIKVKTRTQAVLWAVEHGLGDKPERDAQAARTRRDDPTEPLEPSV